MSDCYNESSFGGRGIPINSDCSGLVGSTTGNIRTPIIFVGDEQFKTSEVYKTQSHDWVLIDDCLGDTSHLRQQGTKYLPREPKESPAAYDCRLGRSFFNPFFRDGSRGLISRPFSNPISIEGDEFDKRISDIKHNADLLGSDLTSFFRDVMLIGVRFGMCHVLVDMPTVPLTQSIAEQNATGARPNFKVIPPYDLVWFDTENSSDGSTLLKEVHIKELINVDGENVLHMRVYRSNDWELWAKDTEGWVLVDSGEHTFGTVPLITYYTNRTGFLQSEPPLKSVAELNILHWQTNSDQRSILHMARVCLLFFKGVTEEETDFAVSVNNLITSANENATLEWVECSGKSIEAGQADVERVEDDMKRLLGIPATERTLDTTATGAFIRESKASSDILAWSLSLEAFITRCYTIAGLWLGLDLPDDFKINVFTDFVTAGRIEDIPLIDNLYDKQLISRETLLQEYKRRSVLPMNFNIDNELEKADDEKREDEGTTE